jgi:FMNH2-dependent dimethyl sulfone monooxygenase
LRSGLVGTPEQVAERIAEFEQAGVDLLLLQFSPQLEEMERFSELVIRSNAGVAQPPSAVSSVFGTASSAAASASAASRNGSNGDHSWERKVVGVPSAVA